ncbi:MAG: hypothetical protein Q9221_003308 [Calogaya cf. arnoldii]
MATTPPQGSVSEQQETTATLSPKAQAMLQAAKAETGFDSYYAYLASHGEDTRPFSRLCGPLRSLTESKEESRAIHRKLKFQEGCAVLNLSEDCRISTDAVYCTQNDDGTHGTDMVEALCHPPADTKLQICMWDISSLDEYDNCEAFGDLIGLRYQLDPVIFSAIDASRNRGGNRHRTALDRWESTHVKIGNVVATLCYPKDGDKTPPMLLIAGSLNPIRSVYSRRPEALFKSCPPFKSLSGEKESSHWMPPYHMYSFYPGQLNRLINYYNGGKTEFEDLCFICLIPVLNLNLVKLRVRSSVIQDSFERSYTARSDSGSEDESDETSLYADRARLRRKLNDLENAWSSVGRYMRSRLHWDPLGNPCFQDVEKDFTDTAKEANRLEGQIREYLQLQTGILALKESRKSIEVSNQQIQEGKRVKTITILAFIYVPLTLTTSIYGMNLQQLNGSGQTVWVFVVTAVIALLITAGTWYVSETANSYRGWHRRRAEYWDRVMINLNVKQPDFNVAERAAMIVWLLNNQYFLWMRSTGAWWKIVLNSSRPFTDGDGGRRSAGELVSRASLGQLAIDLRHCMPIKPERKDTRTSTQSRSSNSSGASV